MTAGLLEGRRLQAARRRVSIRIHVNGSRGKSDVTRLVAGALRAAGVRTLGKVTGVEPRWLLPDGREVPVRRRRGRARIQEQAEALRLAAALECRALVVECMALRPELQWISEHSIIRSTIGIITNARPDHAAHMGWDRRSVAQTLGNTVPRGGVLVCGDEFVCDQLRPLAAARIAQIRLAPRRTLPSTGRIGWHAPENVAVALDAAACAGIDEQVAMRAFEEVALDPGAARWTIVDDRGGTQGRVMLLDALAVNDPDSLATVMEAAALGVPAGVYLIFHHRRDRDDRARAFHARFCRWIGEGVRWRSGATSPVTGLWVTGAPWPRVLLKGAALFQGWAKEPGEVLRGALDVHAAGEVVGEIVGLDGCVLVVMCGNLRGADRWRREFKGWRPVRFHQRAVAEAMQEASNLNTPL